MTLYFFALFLHGSFVLPLNISCCFIEKKNRIILHECDKVLALQKEFVKN